MLGLSIHLERRRRADCRGSPEHVGSDSIRPFRRQGLRTFVVRAPTRHADVSPQARTFGRKHSSSSRAVSACSRLRCSLRTMAEPLAGTGGCSTPASACRTTRITTTAVPGAGCTWHRLTTPRPISEPARCATSPRPPDHSDHKMRATCFSNGAVAATGSMHVGAGVDGWLFSC